MTVQLLIVILNFDGIEDTLECLNSLCSQTYKDVVTQVIDNGSKSDDLSRISDRFPKVEIIALPDNLGWAGGNNIGMQQALDRGFDHVCLLNNDTVLDPTAIEELLAAAASIDQPCLLHPTIAYFDVPTEWQLNPQPPPFPVAAGSCLEARDIVEMNWAYGACLLLPATVLKKVGMFDERFFLQLEETDYFERAKAVGVQSFCALRARILHKESASFGGTVTETKTYYQVRNGLLLAEKHAPNLGGFLHAAHAMMWALHHQAQSSGIKINGWPSLLRWLMSAHPIARAAREGARDYACRHFGRRRLKKVAAS